jgi:hypothetical protein
VNRIVAGWNRFWFEPVSTAPLVAVRIAFGVLALLWTLSLAPDLHTFFTGEGLLPMVPPARHWWGVFDVSSAWPVVLGVYVALLIGSVALVLGWWTRMASIVVFVGILSFERRSPNVFNSGDSLVRNIAFYLALAPAGAALSLSRWRRHRDAFWAFPARAPWALRLLQIHVSVIYLTTVWAKVRGDVWNDGTAVSYALRLDDLVRFGAPSFLATSEVWSNLLTWGTLAVELAVGILVWNRRARPWVLAAGVALHLGIELSLHVGFFSMAIFVSYLAFVPAEVAERVLRRLAVGPFRGLGTPIEV